MLNKVTNNQLKTQSNKKIIFDDDGNTVTVSQHKKLDRPIKKTNITNNNARTNIESDISRWYEEVNNGLFNQR